MDYIDPNGIAIRPGQVAKIQTKNDGWKIGAVSLTYEGLVTIRHNITDNNPDGNLFSAVPSETIVLIT